MPRVQAILETALYVRDISAAADFYRRLFGFEVLLASDRLIALDVAGRSVLLLFRAGATTAPFTMPGGTIPGHGGAIACPTHFAFSISADDLPAWRQKLQEEKVAIESEVAWAGGAKSLYFRDLDENLVELITPGFWRTF